MQGNLAIYASKRKRNQDLTNEGTPDVITADGQVPMILAAEGYSLALGTLGTSDRPVDMISTAGGEGSAPTEFVCTSPARTITAEEEDSALSEFVSPPSSMLPVTSTLEGTSDGLVINTSAAEGGGSAPGEHARTSAVLIIKATPDGPVAMTSAAEEEGLAPGEFVSPPLSMLSVTSTLEGPVAKIFAGTSVRPVDMISAAGGDGSALAEIVCTSPVRTNITAEKEGSALGEFVSPSSSMLAVTSTLCTTAAMIFAVEGEGSALATMSAELAEVEVSNSDEEAGEKDLAAASCEEQGAEREVADVCEKTGEGGQGGRGTLMMGRAQSNGLMAIIYEEVQLEEGAGEESKEQTDDEVWEDEVEAQTDNEAAEEGEAPSDCCDVYDDVQPLRALEP
ncbi:hypothetical protein CEUSTIGMA_g9758.t1 [Chlamydomonas eustigma]|uniref:Uncharacterized protein n=1 Tax=Chlamydomonas eustigma TaxID=1157962 RepID=A0A250XHD4_9CHLO|nr:hypothetical protein CEUSTIGMA_g9758.t1 [Chlamydomonas eustigma]|eukprot:GAX82329.1 hypothetical protein CEUSTIGMA_g9758.t1 [Chlamydomonas eustigma]